MGGPLASVDASLIVDEMRLPTGARGAKKVRKKTGRKAAKKRVGQKMGANDKGVKGASRSVKKVAKP
jgi:hypothetical protein